VLILVMAVKPSPVAREGHIIVRAREVEHTPVPPGGGPRARLSTPLECIQRRGFLARGNGPRNRWPLGTASVYITGAGSALGNGPVRLLYGA
jgi:hypothetical protein